MSRLGFALGGLLVASGLASETARAAPSEPAQVVAGAAMGRSLRFNNPYRLPSSLTDDPGGLSLTALHLEAYGAFLMSGGEGGLLHGARLGVALPLTGIRQLVVSPAYLVASEVSPKWLLGGWLAAPLVVAPDTNLGVEAAVTLQYRVYGGLRLVGEVVGDLFFGAATPERRAATYPLLGAQLGLAYSFEVER